ncbi:hypothetical protein G4Y79_15125 [Phototrophicus methaneseepsis]|uniref:Uncharacterized protein n=1 Tax=Phototrophicus methaneseepsis TaxID=2710758 RepID=A0A7S8E692_9CHLR|nr:hypothetical protein [Phototrophicus methaneseepsis]QPC81034.1 hypothetical protein G4Y79_15125 [Phototrophicus methaneseepsis]
MAMYKLWTVNLMREPALDQLLAYLLPGEDGHRAVWREVGWFNDATIKKGLDDQLIVQHPERPGLYAISKKGYEALRAGKFKSEHQRQGPQDKSQNGVYQVGA